MRAIALCSSMLLLAACGAAFDNTTNTQAATDDGCGSEWARSAVEDTVKKGLRDALRSELSGEATSGQIRPAADSVSVELANVRTSMEGSGSSKKTCNALVTLTFPSGAIENVDSIRALQQESSSGDWSRDFDVDRVGTGFRGEFEYSVQPTDDKKTLYAEIPGGQGLMQFATGFLATQLRSGVIRQAAAAEAQQVREQAQFAQQAETAAVEEAKINAQLARQTINALWTSIPKEDWGPILPLQRAWVQKKEAQCRLEAASASTDPEQKAVTFLNCDARLTQERIGWLRQNMPSEPGFDE